MVCLELVPAKRVLEFLKTNRYLAIEPINVVSNVLLVVAVKIHTILVFSTFAKLVELTIDLFHFRPFFTLEL
jgi:hypothetical protein